MNKEIHIKSIKAHCIYLWNEPLDVGCHLAVINFKNSGCYECFFKRNSNTDELFDATAYTEPGQIIVKNSRGCSGSFVPYASNVSLRTVIACMEWVEKILTDRCNNNILVSIKGDAYNFNKAGYRCSNVYYNQKNKETVIDIANFKYGTCSICGDKIDGN